MLGLSLGAAAVAAGVSIAAGLALLEIPFSLPTAVCIALVLCCLGLLVVVFVARAPKSKVAVQPNADCLTRCAPTAEIVLLAVFGLLSIAGGIFALLLYFQARALPAAARLAM